MEKLVCVLVFFNFVFCQTNAKFYGYGVYQRDLPNQNEFNYETPDLGSFFNDNENIQYPESSQWQTDKTAKEVENWPEKNSLLNLGQVAGVATSKDGNVHIFHRGDTVWDESSFDSNNVYKHKDRDPIINDTVKILDSANGKIIKSWGSRRFYMPHGISIDPQGNVWLTDVALHQVFRFKKDQYSEPDLVLGERFVPGTDEKHFCKPTDVAIASSGIVFISDGYCNQRILIFSPEGNLIEQFGSTEGMLIPHSITLLENEDLLCVADRENRRILCFTAGLNGDKKAGKLIFNIQHPQLGRVFAIDHMGDVMLAINGPDSALTPRGISLDLATEQLVDVWEPKNTRFEEPHDIAVSADGTSFYVTEISTNSSKKIFKFNI